MTDPQTPRQPHTTAEVRWAAMRLLLADLLAEQRGDLEMNASRDDFVAHLLDGADVPRLCASVGLSRDACIAALARLVRG